MPEIPMSMLDIIRRTIRSAAVDLPPKERVLILTEILIELDGVRGIELLSQARAAISLRMQELINQRGLDMLAAEEEAGMPDHGDDTHGH